MGMLMQINPAADVKLTHFPLAIQQRGHQSSLFKSFSRCSMWAKIGEPLSCRELAGKSLSGHSKAQGKEECQRGYQRTDVNLT